MLDQLVKKKIFNFIKKNIFNLILWIDYNYDETLSTLRYANRAKSIKNKPKINEGMWKSYKDID